MSRRPSHHKWGGLGLSPRAADLMVREDQRRTEAQASPRERAWVRLMNAVHDVFALEAAAASRVGEPATEAVCHADIGPTEHPSTWDMLAVPNEASGFVDQAGLNRRRDYPWRLGYVAMERRREWLEEHGERLRELEVLA